MLAKLQASHTRPKAPLITTPVKGEWQPVAEQCAWRVNAKDYTGAAKLMYDLLMWNAEALETDPALLAVPSEVEGPIAQLETMRQSEYFMRAANELREGVLLDLQEHQGG
ncbi:hypothetical protein HaLaN_07224, partial [Haematococcus lacustris]